MPGKTTVVPISGYVGVRKNKNRWQAYEGRQTFGTFDTRYEAACARATALNEPPPPPPSEPEVSFVDNSIDEWWCGLFHSGQTWQIGVVSKAELKKKYEFASLNTKLSARKFFEKLAQLLGRQPVEVSVRQSRRVEWCWVLDVDDCPSSLKSNWMMLREKKKASDKAKSHRAMLKEGTREHLRMRGEEYDSDEFNSDDEDDDRAKRYASRGKAGDEASEASETSETEDDETSEIEDVEA